MQPPIVSGPFHRLRQCRHGYVLYNVNDTIIGRSLDLYGEFSEGEVDLFRQLVRPGDVVVDVGANIGVHTLFFAQAVAGHGKVFAFEPQRVLFQTLCANMALNGVTNAHCYQAALGEQDGSVVVPVLDYGLRKNFGALTLGTYAAGEPVPLFRLDGLGLADCRLIKVDVEGMEVHVLRGAAQTIERHKPVLYVENDRPQSALELTRFIDGLGYEMYWHLPPLYNPRNYYQNRENVFPQLASGNLLCVYPNRGLCVSGLTRTYPGDPLPFAT